jgi:hypothetical protein
MQLKKNLKGERDEFISTPILKIFCYDMKWDSKKIGLYFKNFLNSWKEPKKDEPLYFRKFSKRSRGTDKSALKIFLKSWGKSNEGEPYTWKKLKNWGEPYRRSYLEKFLRGGNEDELMSTTVLKKISKMLEETYVDAYTWKEF